MDLKTKLDLFSKEHFETMNLETAIGDRFGRYSKYIIQERAIPDIRDGLKPVQRRILYAMNLLGITSTSSYKKSARICGEVMGKFHPHGDSSIYEAMVRMSQDWKMGVVLIDMHGNNGSIDGDGAAAMRYTESRLSKNADYLLKDIDKNTVPFIPNFDEEEVEPTVLPARFPNLLINGATGISSGYATNIPPHNFNEVINATIALIDNPKLTIDELLEIMPGPDFPTGGIIEDIDGIREAFMSGNGKIVVRSNYTIEKINKEQERIVITEIPYDTNKEQTVKKIDSLRQANKVPDIIEVRDESDREGLRIAIDLKKDANSEAILNYLFKNTDLQINYNYNMVSICNKRPMCLGVIPILTAYINYQKEVVTNRTNFDLNKANKRLHIVEGLIKMVSIVDEVIKTIRASKNRAESKINIMNNFGFSDLQAEAIITMQLYRLSNTDIMQLKEEKETLTKNIKKYNNILENENVLLDVIKDELREISKSLVQPRRSQIRAEVKDISVDETDLVSKEDVVVVVTKERYIKRVSLKSYNASKNNYLKENDTTIFLGETNTLATLLLFTSLGNFIYLPVYKIPECKMKDVGTFVNNLVQIDPKETIISSYTIDDFNDGRTVLLCTNLGNVKQMLLNNFQVNRYTKAVRAMKLGDGETLVSTDMTSNMLELFIVTKYGDGLRFRATDVALRDTTGAGGIRTISLKPKDEVVKALYTNKDEDILILTDKGNIKRMPVVDIPLTKRGRVGTSLVKKVKSNPVIVVSACHMTPNQYKENVICHVVYSNGVDEIRCFNFKYNVGESGKSFVNTNYQNPIDIYLDRPEKADEIVSGDYLVEEDINLFSADFTSEKPLKASKPNYNILNDLDKILEANKGTYNVEVPKDNNEIKIKKEKVTLFDDLENKEVTKEKIKEDDTTITTETQSSVIIRRKKIDK